VKRNLKIRVSGKVQGVFFRTSTKELADHLGLVGFVENLPEGDVYIEAQGDESALKKFVEWCRHGPSKAVVTSVEVDESSLSDYRSFEVQRKWF
jgi:acylphosphatase